MASYELTLKAALEAYPSLFLDEKDVIHQLFFVNGNGLSWEDGELTDGKPIETAVERARASSRDFYQQSLEHAREADIEFYADYWREKLEHLDEENFAEKEREREDARRRGYLADGEGTDCWFVLLDNSLGRVMYPLCQFAKILHVPDDVKPDWLAAAKKAIELAKGPMFKISERDATFLAQAEERLARFSK